MKRLDFIILYLALFISLAAVGFLLKHGVIDAASPVNIMLIMALMCMGPVFACLYGVLYLHGKIHMTEMGVKSVKVLTFFAAITVIFLGGIIYAVNIIGKDALIIFPYIGGPFFLLFILVSWGSLPLILRDSLRTPMQSTLTKTARLFVQVLLIIPILTCLYFLSRSN